MNQNIRRRKIRFWAFLLALVLMLPCAPITVEAKDYSSLDSNKFIATECQNRLYGGDIVGVDLNNGTPYVSYYQSDGSTLMKSDELTENKYTILKYSDMPEDKRESGNYGAWEITYIWESSGKLIKLKLKAIPAMTITYHIVGGGENNAVNPTSYVEGDGVTALNDPTREGYGFNGWYKKANCSGTLETVQSSKTWSGNIDLYGKFDPEEHTITYNVNGADTDETENENRYKVGEGLRELKNAPEPEGYTFDGWYTEDDYSGDKVTVEDSRNWTDDMFLFGRYRYDIEYDLDPDVTLEDGNPTDYTFGEGREIGEFVKEPTKRGYKFDGWYYLTDDGTEEDFTGIPAEQTGVVTLYAKFSPATYSITFDSQGGITRTTEGDIPSEFIFGTGITATDFAKVYAGKEHFSFLGWYNGIGEDATKMTSIAPDTAEDVTLYAKYQGEEFTITYNLDGGTNAATNPDKYYFGTGVTSFAAATKAGYNFDGWYSDAEFTTKVTNISADHFGPVTLYAKYTKAPAESLATYRISYQLDGGTNGAGNPTNYTYGVGVTSFADASKEGYIFDGWYSDAAFTTKVTSISATQKGDVTLYAKFVAEEDQAVEVEDDQDSQDDLSDKDPKTNKSVGDEETEATDTPETGDNSPIALCLWIFAISGLAILFLRRYSVRLKKKN